jgi:hypothetical protein
VFFEIVIQLIGFIAIAFNLIAVQFNTHGKIIAFKTFGSILFCLQYLLLGAYTGMVMDLIGSIRNIVFANTVKKGKSTKTPIIVFSILTVVLGVLSIVLTWDVSKIKWTDNVKIATVLMVIVSIISIIAKLLTTVAYGIKNPHLIRMVNLPSCSLWIVYNFIVFSLAGIVNEIMSITSIIIAEIRFKKPKEKQSKNSKNESGENSVKATENA